MLLLVLTIHFLSSFSMNLVECVWNFDFSMGKDVGHSHNMSTNDSRAGQVIIRFQDESLLFMPRESAFLHFTFLNLPNQPEIFLQCQILGWISHFNTQVSSLCNSERISQQTIESCNKLYLIEASQIVIHVK